MSEPVSLAVCGSNVCGDVAFSCALRRGDELRTARSAAGERGDLAAMLAQLCADNGVRPDQLAEIRVDVGPGSYTGLRVVVTFVRFLQRFGDVSVRTVDSLALMAARARASTGLRLRALLDARRGRYHHGAFRCDGTSLQVVTPSSARKLPDVLGTIEAGDVVVLPGALAAQLGGELAARGALLLPIEAVLAEELYAPDLPFMTATFADLEPRYLMASYAED